MVLELPIVRHFLACEEIVSDEKNVTLRNLIQTIVPLPGEKYPLLREQMALYAVLSNGRGKHLFALELSRFERGEGRRMKRSPGREVDLGQDPLVVLGLPLPLKVMFARPGFYTFHLLCDSVPIAEETILLKEENNE